MMDIRRVVLLAIFAFSLVTLYSNWEKQQARLNPPPVAAIDQPVPGAAANSASGIPQPLSPATPGGPTPAVPGGTVATASAPVAQTQAIVKTDLVIATISSEGGDLRALELTQHKDTDDIKKNFVLLGAHHYFAQTGLLDSSINLPNHKTNFTLTPGTYELKPGENQVKVRLEATAGAIKVAKIYTFTRGSYAIGVDYEITNGGTTPITPSAYLQFVRDGESPPGETRFMHTFTGPAFYTDAERFKKEDFSAIDKSAKKRTEGDIKEIPAPIGEADNGWVAMVQHYFTSAWLPQGNAHRTFYVDKLPGSDSSDLYTAGIRLQANTIAPGATGHIDAQLFAGPEEVDTLTRLAPGFDRVKDYGWLTIIAEPMYKLLAFLHGYLGNWGLSIIALTVIIKAIFFPLSAASYRSMARMKKITPKMTALREKYAGDRAKMNQAMMELYKTEKINPLGGCFPIVIQIPVFISLYWALLATVELRHAPFYGWITDLSAPDTLFGTLKLPFFGDLPFGLLPILMAVSMFLQTKLNPPPPDPVQAKMMMIMPLVFSALFFFFPAGLVLYYVVNNVLSITQQYTISRMMARSDAAAAATKADLPAKR